jgi:hypothetical protein
MEQIVLQSNVGDESVIPLVERAIQGRIQELDATLRLMEISLREYELKHEMFSRDFYRQYLDDDKLPDTVEFQMWAGEYEMYQRVLAERRALTGVQVCPSSNTLSS